MRDVPSFKIVVMTSGEELSTTISLMQKFQWHSSMSTILSIIWSVTRNKFTNSGNCSGDCLHSDCLQLMPAGISLLAL